MILHGVGSITDMQTGVLTDPMVAQYQAAQAAAAAAPPVVVVTPAASPLTWLLIAGAAAAGWWYYTKHKGSLRLPELLKLPFTE